MPAKQNKTNILFISHYPDLSMGGQKSMYLLIQQMNLDEYSAFAVTPEIGELSNELEKIGCKTYFIKFGSVKPKNFFTIIKNIFSLLRIIKKHNIHIIHSDQERATFFCGIAAKIAGIKMIWHIRVTAPYNLDKYNSKLASQIIGISHATKNRLKDFNVDDKFTVVFNGVNCEIFKPIENKLVLLNELNLPNDRPIILFAGQLKTGKGIFDILESIKIIKEQNKYFPLFIFIGKYNDENTQHKFESQIAEYDIENYVAVYPFQKEIQKLMQCTDFLLLPSHEGVEGMGRVVFEAMACGKPVIGTNISGVKEAITESTGLLVPPCSPTELAKGINSLLSLESISEKYMIECRNHALKNFDIKQHALNIQSIYDKLKTQD